MLKTYIWNPIKTLLLKLVLNNKEKRFFWLIAPEDITRTKSTNGYLWKWGWWSQRERQGIPYKDSEGNPLPWFTYPAISFLRDRIREDLFIFEYGIGSSTYFFAQYAQNLYGVEHDKEWMERLTNTLPENLILTFQPVPDSIGYVRAARTLNTPFDIIVVDGRNRVKCCEEAILALSDQGVLILDDSHRKRYYSAIVLLKKAGFKRIDFYGLRTGAHTESCTSIFYKEENCLCI